MSSRSDTVLEADGSVRPLVRPTRAQIEIDLLPPYGDPEVHLLGELATYALVGATLNAVFEYL